jgi:hypothetical protein
MRDIHAYMEENLTQSSMSSPFNQVGTSYVAFPI